MRDGMYQVVFRTRLGSGIGFAALNHGIICGGDRGMNYSGTYGLFGDDFVAKVEIENHSSNPVPTVFGIDCGVVALEGRSIGDGATLAGAAEEAPHLAFHATLTRLPD